MKSICIVALVLVMACTAAVAGTFEYPDTRAGDVARAYIESFNSADVAQLAAFAAEYRSAESLAKRSAEERAKQTLGIREQSGELVPADVIDQTAMSITLRVHATKLDMWMSCKFDIETDAPHKLTGVMMMPTAPPDMAAGGEVIEWDTLQQLLAATRERSAIPAIAAARIEDGRIVDVAVVGVRSAEDETPAVVTDVFHIGSISKSVTATMIAGLVEFGDLDWDTRIGDVLTDMDVRAEYRDVTVAQLLQHRGGFDSYAMFEDADDARLNAPGKTPTEYRRTFVAEVVNSEPAVAPGTAMHYSNAGYVVAGYMAEVATGDSWETLVERYVLTPLDMNTSGFGMAATESRRDQPRGHTRNGDHYEVDALAADYPYDAFIAPAGNMYMAIEDLARYAAFHLAGLRGEDAVLQASTVSYLHTPVDRDGGRGYASGWFVMETEAGDLHTHSGSMGSSFATIAIYPEHNCAMVVAMTVGPSGASVADALIEAMLDRAVAAQP